MSLILPLACIFFQVEEGESEGDNCPTLIVSTTQLILVW